MKNRRRLVPGLATAITLMAICSPSLLAADIDRTRLPIPQPTPEKVTAVLPADVPLPTPWEVRAPDGAPNVVIILLDDIGFGAPSPFGGPVNMPTLQQLADNGLSYNRFHTIALCAPTRGALKSGRNHHRVNMGSIPEIATGYAGNTTVIPDTAAPIAEVLRQNGFNTAAFGKWHETPGRETTAAGPQTRWPTRQGFEKFYGFLGAEENMYEPSLHDGVTIVDFPDKPGYHLLEDMTDQAIGWVRQQQGMRPDKPFFIYYSSAGSHAPHQVAPEWIEKYKGKFDQGWDAIRAQTLKDQIARGVVPEGTELAQKPASVPDWDDLTDDQRKVYARQAEVFAAFSEYSDYQAGRLLKAIDDLGALDNTLVIYISGDNGTSPEGDQTGHWNWGHFLNGVPETTEEQLAHLDEWGGPTTYAHMSVGWAIAFDSPFAFTKQVAGDFGGTRNGTVVHWPDGIKAKGEVREQFTHVIDVVPTILEATGIPEPTVVDGIPQIPIQGTSMMYSFDDGDADEQHTVQYFEIIGNRGLYQDGWLARTTVKLPWETTMMNTVAADDGWELYNTLEDFSLRNNLADQYPERLEAMRATFMDEAIAKEELAEEYEAYATLTEEVEAEKRGEPPPSPKSGAAALLQHAAPGQYAHDELSYVDAEKERICEEYLQDPRDAAAALERSEARVGELEAALRARDAEVKDAVAALEASAASIAELEGALATRDAEVKDAVAALEAGEARIAELERTLSTREAEAKDLAAALEASAARVGGPAGQR